MTLATLATALVLLATAGRGVMLLRRTRDWRSRALVGAVAVLAVGSLLHAVSTGSGMRLTWGVAVNDLAELGQAAILLLTLELIRLVWRRHQRVVRAYEAERSSSQTLRPLQKAVETTQLGVTVTDLEGRIIFTNPADAAMHGYSVAELIGQDIRVFAPKGKRRPMAPAQLQAMGSWRRETTNARKDQSVFPVHLMSDVVQNDAGEVVAVVTTCEDITKRKEGEAALRESEERYALAAQGAKSVMLNAMIAMAHDLGIEVVAQGVETEEQEARLRELQCEHAQGFLYSQPVEADRVPDLVTGRTKA